MPLNSKYVIHCMLTIRDRTFDLSSATFDAILSLDEDAGWQLQWSFEFEVIGRKFDGQIWQPRLYAETLKLSLPAPASLAGHTFHVSDAYNADDDPNFTLYVFEHEPACDVRVTFGRWDGDAIELMLAGKADVNWDDDYGTSLPIGVECTVVFEGIRSAEAMDARRG